MFLCERRLNSNQTLTSDLKLTVLSGTQHRVSQAEPRQLFAELRQEIVCNKAYNSSQDVQNKAKCRLWVKRGKKRKENEHEKSVDICHKNLF